MSNDNFLDVANIDHKARTITFFIRDGFGNGKDLNGLDLADKDFERKNAVRLFEECLDILVGIDNYWLTVSDKERV